MFFNRDLKAESETLAKWLISIPSVTGSRGESIIMQAVGDGLAGFPYFKAHPEKLHFIGHADQKNTSIAALIKAPGNISSTLVLCCSIDTFGLENYGRFKNFAFKTDELKAELLSAGVFDKLKLEDGSLPDMLPGLGVLECKAGAACFIAALKEISDHAAALEFNILFLCLSEVRRNYAGIMELLPFLQDLAQTEHLDFYAALQTAPISVSDPKAPLPVYTSAQGCCEPCFFILGEHSAPDNPYSGFSAGLIGARLIELLELNPAALRTAALEPLVPQLTEVLNARNALLHTDCAALCFKLNINNTPLSAVVEGLKQLSAQAVERCAELNDEREALYCSLHERPYQLQLKDAEILTYSELFARAARQYPGQLTPAVESLQRNCLKEGLSARESICCIIEKLNEFVNLPRPSIVIYMGPGFIPRTELVAARREDREHLMLLHAALQQLSSLTEVRARLTAGAAPCALNFLRPQGADQALELLDKENPLGAPQLLPLDCPGIILGIRGGFLQRCGEYADSAMFRYVPAFVFNLLNALSRHQLQRRMHSSFPDLPPLPQVKETETSEKAAPAQLHGPQT